MKPQPDPIMKHAAPPEMHCAPLPRFDLDDWSAIRRSFEPMPGWKLRQDWLASPSDQLRAGLFKAGTWADALVVFAELHDEDIFNPVTLFNEVAFTHGDAFEMFLRPEGQDAYFEFHVTPTNQQLQLRFESATHFRSLARLHGKDALQRCKVAKRLFDSRVQVDAAAGLWRVAAVIPFSSVIELPNTLSLERWLFSASRYDYTRGHKRPVLSSTSGHTLCDFHRQHEWGTLHLRSLAPVASASFPREPRRTAG